MRRFALVVVFVLASVTAHAQQPKWNVNLQSLGIGPIYGVIPIELDGRPGSEYLVKVHIFASWYRLVVPTSHRVVCEGIVELPEDPQFLDSDGDKRMEYLKFDFVAQTVSPYDFDLSKCR